MTILRCQLHELTDREHLVPSADVVGVIPVLDGVPRPDRGLIPADLDCAVRAGVDPARIVDWDPAQAWPRPLGAV